ncbi:peptidoglycan-binding domain-containing protein [Catellatospora methionotrophica]|uniref:peptidoglycan-binding domain-containing protein n=1 Tax=Catellatospora methionotrophica TaxID=121620 RepID=UPI0033FCF91C
MLAEDSRYGRYGTNTWNAVKSVQAYYGLTQDGYAGPNTRKAMKHWNQYGAPASWCYHVQVPVTHA